MPKPVFAAIDQFMALLRKAKKRSTIKSVFVAALPLRMPIST
jgi:hypothetical protein